MTDDATDCGCCAGAERHPGVRFNAPGQPAIEYRIGRHGEFKATLLARLSSADYPALAGLRTRDDDDFSIAACDAGALMLDVLSFYQERIANEAYLRTAVERRSVIELARLIGYQPSPGVAAATLLAFALEDAPGLRSQAALPVTIPAGTRVQSIPGPDEEPQTFETTAAAPARVEWNAIPAQTRETQVLGPNIRELFLAGVSHQVQNGDVILIVGDERIADANSTRWNARVVSGVEIDNDRDLTRLTWADGLGLNPAERGVRVFVFRLRTALFGHNASDARLLRLPNNDFGLTDGANATLEWLNYKINNDQLDLDSAYPKVLPGSWLLLAGGSDAAGMPSLPGAIALYRVGKMRQLSRSDFGISGKVTRIDPEPTAGLVDFGLKETLVLAQSEELPLAAKPLDYPLYGGTLALGRRDMHLAPRQAVAISGKRQRLRIVADDAALQFKPDDGAPVAAESGDSFILTAAPTWLIFGIEVALPAETLDYVLRWKPLFPLRWRLEDRDGRRGTLDAAPSAVALQTARKDDPLANELVWIGKLPDAVRHSRDRSTLQFSAPLANVYQRDTVAVCANLAPASHGESVGEIAGSGDASRPDQNFLLKQAPLTYVSAATPSGRSATLQVRVNGELWNEAPSLFERGRNEHVYVLRQDDEQRSIVQFGDGNEGARLPSGSDNLRFGYRKGLGVAGNVRAGQLTTLLGRPLGVKTANNPVAAAGGQDRESRDDTRRNAPQTMLTLGRAVSIQDYSDFARSFAGVDKALAIWMPGSGLRGVFISVAGPGGETIAATGTVHANLTAALRAYGDPLLPLRIQTYRPVRFRIKAKLKIAAASLSEEVVPRVADALRAHFAFERRDFAQTVSLDEVMAVIHGVRGVEAADVDQLYRRDPGAIPALQPRLFAMPPQVQADGGFESAELLTLEPGPLALEVMP